MRRRRQVEKQPTQHAQSADGDDRVQPGAAQLESAGGAGVVDVGEADDIADQGDRTVQRHRVDDDRLGDLVEDQGHCNPPYGSPVAEGDQFCLFLSAWLLHAMHRVAVGTASRRARPTSLPHTRQTPKLLSSIRCRASST